MTDARSSQRPNPEPEPAARPLVGLALAGGAAQGAIYEIGALRALDEALKGFNLNDSGVFVGVSAGGFLASCLANGLSTAQMCRAIVKLEPGEHPFVPEIFFQPAFGEVSRRLTNMPKLLAEAITNYMSGRERRLLDSLTGLGRALPVGLFDNGAVCDFVSEIFSKKGRTDDFRQLSRKLAVVTTDVESGEAAVWGQPGRDNVPISKAVQATTALPGLYPPVEIDGRYYVDGVLLKTMHASVALEAGAELVFCVNPVVPVDTRAGERSGLLKRGHLIKQGLPGVLSQTVRTLIHSRMNLGLRAYEDRYPDSSVILIEPRRDDYETFFSNIFSFAARRIVCDRAYQNTRRSLRQRRDEIEPVLDRHGIRLNHAFLEDDSRSVWSSVGLPQISAEGPDMVDDTEVVRDLGGVLDRLEGLLRRGRNPTEAAETVARTTGPKRAVMASDAVP